MRNTTSPMRSAKDSIPKSNASKPRREDSTISECGGDLFGQLGFVHVLQVGDDLRLQVEDRCGRLLARFHARLMLGVDVDEFAQGV